MRYNVSLTNWLADACVANKSSRQCAAPRRNTRMREKEKAREGERRKEEERRREKKREGGKKSDRESSGSPQRLQRVQAVQGGHRRIGECGRGRQGWSWQEEVVSHHIPAQSTRHSRAQHSMAEDSRAWHSRGQHSGEIQSAGRIIEHDTRDHVALAALVRSTRNLTSQTFTASNTLSLTCAYP